jgi:type IV pilus assembly protein PilQ
MNHKLTYSLFRVLILGVGLTSGLMAQSGWQNDASDKPSRPQPTGGAVYDRAVQKPQADPGKVEALLAVPLPGEHATSEAYYPTDGSSGGIDFSANNQPVHEVFSTLRLALRRNIVIAPDVEGKYTGDLYSVEPEEAIDLICKSMGLVAIDEGNYISIEIAKMKTRSFAVRHLPAADLVALLKPAQSEKGKLTSTAAAAGGIESSQSETGGAAYANDGMIVVTDFPENLKIIKKIDRAPMQVMVEVTILNADIDDRTQMGVNFNGLSGIGFREYGATSSDGFSITDNVFSADDLGDGFASAGTDLASSLGTSGMQFGFISGNVGIFLRALSEKTAIAVQTNTTVMTANKQRGEVLLGRRDGYKTIRTETGGATSEEVEFLETGTQLIFRPFIQANGVIRMEIHPEDSDGGLNSAGLPFEETAELTSNVMVRDGDTLIIGGLFRDKKFQIDNKVPVLGSLPLVGPFFSSKDHATKREEVIILLTPHILDMSAQAEKADSLDGLPNIETGSDREKVAQLYSSTARVLVLEGHHGAALALLNAGSIAAGDDDLAFDMAARITEGMVPEFTGRTVDARILDSLKRWSKSHR